MYDQKMLEEFLADESGEKLNAFFEVMGEMLVEHGVDWFDVNKAFRNAALFLEKQYVPSDKYLDYMRIELLFLEEKVKSTREFIDTYEDQVKEEMMRIAEKRSGIGNA